LSSEQSRIATDPIGLFVPHATPEERKLRQRLNNARTLASARAVGSQSDNARTLFWMVEHVASGWIFAGAKMEHLEAIANTLVRLFQSASDFERIEGEQANG
jgi:hypothetical protein